MKPKLVLTLLVLNALLFLIAAGLLAYTEITVPRTKIDAAVEILKEELAYVGSMGLPDAKQKWYEASLQQVISAWEVVPEARSAIVQVIGVSALFFLINTIGLAVIFPRKQASLPPVDEVASGGS